MTWWLAEAPAERQHWSASWWREPPLLEHQGQEERDGFCCCPAELLVWTTGSSLLRNTSVEKSDIRTQQGVIYNVQDKSHSTLRFGARHQGQSWPMTSHWDEYHQGSALSFPCKRPLKVPLKARVTLRLSRLPTRNNRIIPCKDGWGQGGPPALHSPTSDNLPGPSVDNPALPGTRLSPKPPATAKRLKMHSIDTKCNLHQH